MSVYRIRGWSGPRLCPGRDTICLITSDHFHYEIWRDDKLVHSDVQFTYQRAQLYCQMAWDRIKASDPDPQLVHVTNLNIRA